MPDKIRTIGLLILQAFILSATTSAEPARNGGNLEFERFTIPGTGSAPPISPAPSETQPPPPQDTPKHVPDNHFLPHHGFDGFHHAGHRSGVYYGDDYYYRGPVVGVYSPIDPNLVIYPPRDLIEPSPPSPADLARAGRVDEALARLDDLLDETPDDPEILLQRAVVLALSGRFDAALDSAEAALTADPDAILGPLDGVAFTGSSRRLRRTLIAAVRRAQRSGEPRAWILVAVLMHSEHRDAVARRMLRRATPHGPAGLAPAP